MYYNAYNLVFSEFFLDSCYNNNNIVVDICKFGVTYNVILYIVAKVKKIKLTKRKNQLELKIDICSEADSIQTYRRCTV